MSGVIYASLLALTMSVAACSTSETAPPPSVKSKEKNGSNGGNTELTDVSSEKKDKSPSAFHIRSNRKQTLEEELQLLESDLLNAMGNYNTLRGQKYRTLDKGIAGMGDPTVQGKLVEAGTSFLFGGLGMALSGIGSAGSAAASTASQAGKAVGDAAKTAGSGGTSGGGGSVSTAGLDGLSNGFVAVGGAISAGITKSENDKTIKRITGTVEEMMQQWEVEIANIQAQIDQKQAEIDSLVNMGV